MAGDLAVQALLDGTAEVRDASGGAGARGQARMGEMDAGGVDPGHDLSRAEGEGVRSLQ